MKLICDKCGGKGFIQSDLAQLRKSKGFTQSQIAESLKMQRSTYAMVELGQSTIVSSRILPLAELLGVTADDLLKTLYGEDVKES